MSRALRLSVAMVVTWSSLSVSAQNFCANIYDKSAITVVTPAHSLISSSPQDFLSIRQFANLKSELSTLLTKIPEDRARMVRHLLDASLFFDYADMAGKLVPNLLNNSRQSFDFSTMYDRSERAGMPYASYLKAREYLRTEKPAVTADLILEIHRRALDGNVEGVRKDQLGTWKDSAWSGNATGEGALTEAQVNDVKSSPYLVWEQKSSRMASPRSSVWKSIVFWGKEMKSTFADPTANPHNLFEGSIRYPNLGISKKETVDLIKDSHPDIWAKATDWQAKNPKKSAPADLEGAFTKALTEERVQRFLNDRQALGPITETNVRSYVDLVADLQRDLVSIHPVSNGNGRSTRLFMNYLLEKEGLPPSRILDADLDVQGGAFDTRSNVVEWRDAVYRGVLDQVNVQTDVMNRIRQGLTVEYSPEVIYPAITLEVKVDAKREGSTSVEKDAITVKVDDNQFVAFIQTLSMMYPELKTEIANNRLASMERLNQIFTEWYKSKTIYYTNQKDGSRKVSLQLVEQDFIDSFGVVRAERKDLWDYKMGRFYDRSEILWRGLSNQQKEYTDADLLSYFVNVSSHMASNAVLSKTGGTGQNLVTLMKEDFQQYNKELLNGDVIEMAMDHHRTGPRYATGYGYSTSKREVVGKAFAMGAMVLGKYGEQADPALQAKLKSRINVASYKAEKDLDLGRLRQFSEEFSYMYGRQAEVMGIGGTEPDAIMLVQRIGADGEVIHTFARNPDLPSQILRLNGRWTPEEGPMPMDKVTARYEIRNGQVVSADQALVVAPQADAVPKPLVENRNEKPKVYVDAKKGKVVQPEGFFGWVKGLFGGN